MMNTLQFIYVKRKSSVRGTEIQLQLSPHVQSWGKKIKHPLLTPEKITIKQSYWQ